MSVKLMTVWLMMAVSQRNLTILAHLTVALVSWLITYIAAIGCTIIYYLYTIIVDNLQVGFSQSSVAVDEDAGMVTLTIELNQNAWVTKPVTVTYSTSQVTGATNAASKFYIQPFTGMLQVCCLPL